MSETNEMLVQPGDPGNGKRLRAISTGTLTTEEWKAEQ